MSPEGMLNIAKGERRPKGEKHTNNPLWPEPPLPSPLWPNPYILYVYFAFTFQQSKVYNNDFSGTAFPSLPLYIPLSAVGFAFLSSSRSTL
jgi:hypothetical protein